jgi:putative MATE family efflux protein
LGEKNEEWVKKSATYSMIVALILVILISVLGIFTIQPLFALLGATSVEMPYIIGYMRIWYLGAPFVVIPMVGNNIIRALGDTKVPSLAMTFAAVLNIILDPLFIFGWGFAGIGIQGAAIATVISRFTTFLVCLYLLIKREKVLVLSGLVMIEFLKSTKALLKIALPAAISRAIIPFGTGVVTAMIAVFGQSAVAGFGAGVKIEGLAICVPNALSTVMIAYTGQNFGAQDFDRIKKGYRTACVYCLIYSAIAIPLMFLITPLLSTLFNVSSEAKVVMINYVRIAIFGIGFLGIIAVSNGVLNAVGKPIKAALTFIIFMFVVYIPLSKLFSTWMQESGVFVSALIAYVVAGFVSYMMTSGEIHALHKKMHKA